MNGARHPRDLNGWIYIYYIREGCLYYDRTVDRHGLGPHVAKARIEVLESRGYEAFYTIGDIARTPAFS